MTLEEKVNLHRPPRIYQSRSGPLTIVGSASGVWDDLAGHGKVSDGEVMTVNLMTGVFYEFTDTPVTHAVTMHVDELPHLVGLARKQENLIITHSNKPGADCVWLMAGLMNSGIMATVIGLLMGYRPIVLCGMPNDYSPSFYGPTCQVNNYYGDPDGANHRCWKEFLPYFKGKVFSLSGNTRKWLGEP